MKLTIIRGLPGSGKSTLAKKVAAAQGAIHVENDMFFVGDDGVYRYDAARLQQAIAWCTDTVERHIKQGAPVVVSNTFVRIAHFLPYVELAESAGYQVRIIEAQGCWPNVHGVADEVILQMRRNWESCGDILDAFN